MRSKTHSHVWFPLLIVVILTAVVIRPAGTKTEPDRIRWSERGELLAPLPADPALRAAAIAEARARFTGTGAGRVAPAQRAVSATLVIPRVVTPGQNPHLDRPPLESHACPRIAPDPDRRRDPGGRSEPYPPLDVREIRVSGHDAGHGPDAAPAIAPTLMQSFQGLGPTGGIPSDADVAAGPEHVMQIVNSSFAVYDKCGQLLHEETFADFMGDTTSEKLFDPKVIWDIWDNRWVMIWGALHEGNIQSFIDLSISQTSDPLGGWYTYRLNFELNGSTHSATWADYPDIEVDPQGIYIATNQFTFISHNMQYAKLRVIDKATAYAGQPIGYTDFYNMTNEGEYSYATTLRPCRMYSWPGKMFLINAVAQGSDILTLWTVLGPAVSPTLIKSDVSGVAPYEEGFNTIQPSGGQVDVLDCRLLNAVYRDDFIWAGHTVRVSDGGLPRAGMRINQLVASLSSIVYQGVGWTSGYYWSFPAVDLDDVHRGIVVATRGGPTEFMSLYYVELPVGGPWGAARLLKAGEANYWDPASPHRWGDYWGCQLDPVDWKTFWFTGQYAASDPLPSWKTQIGAASYELDGILSVSPASGLVSTGPVGGPFDPPSITYDVSNIGGSALKWVFTGDNNWNTPSKRGGELAPGATDHVTVTINTNANYLDPATYHDDYYFYNCYNDALTIRNTILTVGGDGSCEGAVVKLHPHISPSHWSTSDYQERGIYITAIEDFDLCAVGMEMDLTGHLPQTVTARIYEADGTTRGPLVASGTLNAAVPGLVTHYVPVSYTLEACKEYDISVQPEETERWNWYSEDPAWPPVLKEPYDIEGIIRVRDAEYFGDPDHDFIPVMHLIGREPECDNTSDLAYPGVTPSDYSVCCSERGVFITAKKTIRLCSIGFRAQLFPPQRITARVYSASGTTRGVLIAEGSLDITQMDGDVMHHIPVEYLLRNVSQYELTVSYGDLYEFPYWSLFQRPMPYTVDDAIEVRWASENGSGDLFLPHMEIGWKEDYGGMPFDLIPPTATEPTNSGFTDNLNYGAYVLGLATQEVYAIGFMADIPVDELVRVWVYEASGTTRGDLVASGALRSADPGVRWHDIPIAMTLHGDVGYDIEVRMTEVTEFPWYDDRPHKPYDAYGVIRVLDSEHDGDPANITLPRLRVLCCNEAATGAGDVAAERPPLYLAPPRPNPVSGSTLIGYSLDEDGPVTLSVYDVKGRLVEKLIDNEVRAFGTDEMRFDASGLPAGVYFVRLQTQAKMVSRKIVVVH